MLSRDLQKTCKDCWDPPELALYSHLGLGCYRGKAAGVGVGGGELHPDWNLYTPFCYLCCQQQFN